MRRAFGAIHTQNVCRMIIGMRVSTELLNSEPQARRKHVHETVGTLDRNFSLLATLCKGPKLLHSVHMEFRSAEPPLSLRPLDGRKRGVMHRNRDWRGCGHAVV